MKCRADVGDVPAIFQTAGGIGVRSAKSDIQYLHVNNVASSKITEVIRNIVQHAELAYVLFALHAVIVGLNHVPERDRSTALNVSNSEMPQDRAPIVEETFERVTENDRVFIAQKTAQKRQLGEKGVNLSRGITSLSRCLVDALNAATTSAARRSTFIIQKQPRNGLLLRMNEESRNDLRKAVYCCAPIATA